MRIAFQMRDYICIFAYPPGYDEAVDQLDNLLEQRNSGVLSEAHKLPRLRAWSPPQLTAESPCLRRR